jgi:hypothetical protein
VWVWIKPYTDEAGNEIPGEWFHAVVVCIMPRNWDPSTEELTWKWNWDVTSNKVLVIYPKPGAPKSFLWYALQPNNPKNLTLQSQIQT